MPQAVPKQVNQFNLFVDGVGFAGVLTELTLPTLEMTTEDHRAGGMDAPLEITMGMEKLELEFTIAEYNKDIMKHVGVPGVAGVQLTAKGSQRRGQEVISITVNMSGQFRKFEPGTWKAGDTTETKFEAVLAYYKYTEDADPIYEIDVLNMKRIIDGVDQLEAERAALGL